MSGSGGLGSDDRSTESLISSERKMKQLVRLLLVVTAFGRTFLSFEIKSDLFKWGWIAREG